MEIMEYNDYKYIYLLYKGVYRDFKYYIISLGTYPKAYIELPKELVNMDYSKLKVHSKINYADPCLAISDEEVINADGIFIGWGYNLYTDYNGYFDDLSLKQWTTEEIDYEVKLAIDQIIQIRDSDKS